MTVIRNVRLWPTFAALAVFSLSGCGTDPSSLSESEGREHLHFAILGGNATCVESGSRISPIGTGVYNAFQRLLGEINSDGRFDITWTASCYRNNNGTIYFSSSDAPDDVRQANTDDFVDRISSMPRIYANSRVFIVGHSYGGWLAMKSAVAAKDGRPFAGVYTIDPISRVHCTFSSPLGCTSAPQDFNRAQREFIRDNSDDWANFYQTKTFYLHSGSIREADENMKLNVSHTAIDDDARVWARIKSGLNLTLNLIASIR